MAIKPIIGRLNNQKDTTGIFKLWKDTNQIYTFGCIVIYTLAVVFYSPVLQLFKLNPNLTYVTNVYFIILFYNLIYSLGAINNSFLQMLKLTKVEIKAEAFDPEDIEMLEDLVLTATNEALRQIEEISSQEMNKITGGLGIPGL